MAREEKTLMDRLIGVSQGRPAPQDQHTMRLDPGQPDHELTSAGGGWAQGGQVETHYVPEDTWRGARMPEEDPELRALRICAGELGGLQDEARHRVIGYLNRRFGR